MTRSRLLRPSSRHLAWVLAAATISLACVQLACLPPSGPTTTPIETVRHDALGPDRARCMVLMMPGAGDGPEDYAEHGFIEQLRRSRVAADVIAIDAHSGYYREESVVERVLTDVIRVERQRGYEKVWIVGISLGGGGTMHLTATHPDEVDGVVLLAPYLGSPRLVRSVRAAGGAHQWSDDSPESADPFRAIWTWLAHRHRSDASVVPVHVAWGNADRMAPVAETLALSLPESQTLQGGGGHKWVVWRDLWRGLTERGFLQRSCGVVD